MANQKMLDQILPCKDILLVQKENKQYKADIAIDEDEEDKRLITGVVLAGEGYEKGKHVVFGKYALYKLTYESQDYFFLSKEDVIATF